MTTAIQREQFRAVAGRLVTGVTVVTATRAGGEPTGMTANAVCSLSLEPLLMLVCFDNKAETLPVVRDSGRFCINVLAADQEALARVFAVSARERDKFRGVGYTLEDGVPVIDGVLAAIVCDLHELLPGGDHTIGVGEVRALVQHDVEPLVWFRGGYRSLD